MGTVPVNIVQKINWYLEHAALWATNQAALSLTAPQTTNMTSKATALQTAYAEQQAAITAAKGKTLALKDALDAADNAASDLLKEIRSVAAVTPGNTIYELAGIPAPATPAPAPLPGTPSDFFVQLVPADGSLHLNWKCVNDRRTTGVLYEVERKVGSGNYQLLGNSGKRKFIDPSLPAGTAEVTYRITAARTTGKGLPATFLVQFGIAAGTGEMTASVTTPKLAA